MAESFLISGVDLLSLECLTAAAVQQAITTAQVREPYGLVVFSDTAPDVVADPLLARFVWWKTVSSIPTGEIYYYDGGAWTLYGIDPDIIVNGSIALAKLSLTGSSPFAIIQVNAAGTALQYISVANAIQNGSITLAKLAVSEIPVVNGGTGASTAAAARTNLGLGTLAILNAASVALGLVQLNQLILVPTTLSLLATDFIPTATSSKIRVAGNGGPVTIVAVPTLHPGSHDGFERLLLGTHAVNTVTLQGEGTLPGSTLRLGAATRTLGLYDQLTLSWDAALGMWCEKSFSDNS